MTDTHTTQTLRNTNLSLPVLSNKTMERVIKLYLLVNSHTEATTKTHIGHTLDIKKCLKQHNGQLPATASLTRVTRKAAGTWRLVMAIILPPTRKLSENALVEYWKRSSRKVNRRLMFGIQMSRKLEVPWFVNSEILDDECIKRSVPHLVRRYHEQATNQTSQERTQKRKRQLQSTLNPKQQPSNVLTMKTGSKRQRITLDIDFSQGSTQMTDEERMRILRKRAPTRNKGNNSGSFPIMRPRPLPPPFHPVHLETLLGDIIQRSLEICKQAAEAPKQPPSEDVQHEAARLAVDPQ